MGYPDLSDSGMSAEARQSEAQRIVGMFPAQLELMRLSDNERAFLLKVRRDQRQPISTKQLFWLRDLKDKYL